MGLGTSPCLARRAQPILHLWRLTLVTAMVMMHTTTTHIFPAIPVCARVAADCSSCVVVVVVFVVVCDVV